MKKSPDLHLFLLKKVHGWCKRQDMTDPEMYFHFTFREFLRRYGMLLTKIETRNYQYGGHHTFTFTPAPGTEIFGGSNEDLEAVFDLYSNFPVFDLYPNFLDCFQYEGISVIRNHNGIIIIRCYYSI